MIRARILTAGSRSDQELGLARLGLPAAAREYLLDKLLPLDLLVTGMSLGEAKRLRSMIHEAPDPTAFPLVVRGQARGDVEDALLVGRIDQVERLVHALRLVTNGGELADPIHRALATLVVPPALELGARRFEWGSRTYVMGVINVTPDSFFDGGRYAGTDAAVAQAMRLVEQGADLLDVGGESTRPGAAPVSEEEEGSRVVPVIAALRARTDAPISVDTRKAGVAAAALEAGAVLVNDVSGLQHDPALAKEVANRGAALCLMHIRGTPETMQRDPTYEDVVEEVIVSLEESVRVAENAGVPRARLLVDPGIGFGKTGGHNLFLLRRLRELRVLGCPVVLGTSRKSFLGTLTGGRPADDRLAASVGSVAAAAALGGVDVVRVHDVAETRDALAVVDSLRDAQEGGSRYVARPARRD